MKKIIPVIISVIAITSTPAQAWGDREQGGLIGFFVGSLITHLYHKNQQQSFQSQRQTIQSVVIIPPAQRSASVPIIGTIPPKTGTCLQHPIYDQHGDIIAYQLSCH